MGYDFVVLGARGLQGKIVCRYLLEQGYQILMCDKARYDVDKVLRRNRRATFRKFDLRDHQATARALREAKKSIVVNCAEGDYNLAVQKLCLRIGAHYLDLGSDARMTAQQFALHQAFQRRGLCAITGCGSVPGIGNVMLAHAAKELDTVDAVDVGFAWTANKRVFVVPFSIISIIEEFLDRPTVVQNGRLRSVAPHSECRVRRVREIGWQREFLARHAEPYTFHRYLNGKGARDIRFYAGFPKFSYEPIMTFIKTGLGGKTPNGNSWRPIDYLAEGLRGTAPPEGYREKENLWVTLTGRKGGRKRIIRMNCLVPTLKGWEEHGCNIDTGIPAAIMAEMIRDRVITVRGSRSPEFFVPVQPFFEEIAKWKMRVYENDERIN